MTPKIHRTHKTPKAYQRAALAGLALAFLGGAQALSGPAARAQQAPGGGQGQDPDLRTDNGSLSAGQQTGSSDDALRFNNAVDAYNKKHYAEASSELQTYLKSNGKDAQAHRLMADILVRQDKLAGAIPEWEAAARLDGNDKTSRGNLGAAYLQTGQFEKATLLYKSAYAKKPKDAETAYYYGLALAGSGRTAEAIPVFQQSAALKPAAPAFMQLGVALDKSGKKPEAAEAFASAARLDPKDPQAPLYAGLIYHQAGSDAKATPLLQQALTLGTDDRFDARVALAEAAAVAKNPDEALKQFGLAAQARPDDFSVWANIGILSQNAGKTAEAVAAYRQALTLKAPAPKALAATQSNLALLLLAQGKSDEAQALLAQAVTNDPTNGRYPYNQGLAYERQSKTADAIMAYKRALAVDPALTDAKQNLARISK